MVDPHIESEILRLYHAERWRVGTIAAELKVHPDVVDRVIKTEGIVQQHECRRRLVDEYVPFIMETLDKYPKLTASRLYDMVKARGYEGKLDHFRTIVGSLRPIRHKEAYLRLRTLPAEQAQVDWGFRPHDRGQGDPASVRLCHGPVLLSSDLPAVLPLADPVVLPLRS